MSAKGPSIGQLVGDQALALVQHLPGRADFWIAQREAVAGLHGLAVGPPRQPQELAALDAEDGRPGVVHDDQELFEDEVEERSEF